MKSLVLIPSYNTGRRLVGTVGEALRHWDVVWVVVDGSTDGSDAALDAAHGADPRLRILRLPHNRGKGAAVLHGARAAIEAGFTHACALDADGQHCAADIPRLIAAATPGTFVLGVPVFGPEAPAARVKGRRVGNTFAKIETFWAGPEDSLYGLRVYPLEPLVRCLRWSIWGRRYDFDTEAAVRLTWAGLRPVNIPTPVRYYTADEGGVSHFHYVRDNLLLTGLHTRLMLGMLLRLPRLVVLRRRNRRALPVNAA